MENNNRYKIVWFNNSKQRVEVKEFEGKNAYENAVSWGKSTLENFKFELIQTIHN